MNIIVYHSITNSINDEKKDTNSAFSFIEWMNNVKIKNFDINNAFNYYNIYLNEWSKKTLVTNSLKSVTRDKYLSLLKEISINYANDDERRYIANIDFTNKNELLIAIPFFAKKIKNICQYIIDRRDSIREGSKKVGSVGSVQHLSKNVCSLLVENSKILTQNTIDLDINDIKIEISPLYETIKTYFDKSDIEFANTFPLSAFPDKFMTIDELADFKKNLVDNSLDKYHAKHLDTDYLSLIVTDKLNKKYTIDTVIKGISDNASNIPNQLYDSIALSSENILIDEDEIGGFFKPQYLGILYYNSTKLTYVIDFDKIEENKVYVFPDPSKLQQYYYNDEEIPLIWFDDIDALKTNVVNGEKFGRICHNSFYPCFYGYQSKQQTLDQSLFGISDDSTDYDFWSGVKNDIFEGRIVHGVNQIQELEDKIVKTNSNIEYYQEDIYGNFYALYKDTGDIRNDNESYHSQLNIINNFATDILSTGVFIPELSSSEYALATTQTDGEGNYGYYYIFANSPKNKTGVIDNTTPILDSATSKVFNAGTNKTIEFDIYKTRYEMVSNELYFRNSNSSIVGKLFDIFPDISVRYGSNITELRNNLIRIDVFNDVLIYTCKNFVLIDKISYDIGLGVLKTPNSPFYLIEKQDMEDISVPFYDETSQTIYFAKIYPNDDELITTADKIFVIDYYNINCSTFILTKLTPVDNCNVIDFSFDTRCMFDIVSMDKPILCKRDNDIALTVLFVDKTGFKHLLVHQVRKNNTKVYESSSVYYNEDVYTNTTNNGIEYPLSSYNLSSIEYLGVDGAVLSGNTNAVINQNEIIFFEGELN